VKSIWDIENERARRGQKCPDSDSEQWEPERLRRIAEVQAKWSDKDRAERAVGFRLALLCGWSVPVVNDRIAQSAIRDRQAEYDGYGSTQTIQRWRKSKAKTVYAAELCLQIELQERFED
jgi:hypothetical protein